MLTVSGRVVGEDGQSVPGATVQVGGMRAGESASAFFGITTKTDEKGRWSRHNLRKFRPVSSGSRGCEETVLSTAHALTSCLGKRPRSRSRGHARRSSTIYIANNQLG